MTDVSACESVKAKNPANIATEPYDVDKLEPVQFH